MSTSIRASYARLAMTARATKDLRWCLCGIRVEPREEGGAYIVATDGHRMIVIIDPDGACDAPIILNPDRATAAALPRVGHKDDTDKATLELSEWLGKPALLVRDPKGSATRLQIGAPILEGSYPKWRGVIPDFALLTENRMPKIQPRFLAEPFAAIISSRRGPNSVQAFQSAPREPIALRINELDNVLYIVMPMREKARCSGWLKTFTGLRSVDTESAKAEEPAEVA